jgi:hypothetical protein
MNGEGIWDRGPGIQSRDQGPGSVIRAVAAASLTYDLGAGVLLLTFQNAIVERVGLPLAHPMYLQLNALFLCAVGLGYLIPLRHVAAGRAYLWIAGVALKTAGAALFAVEYTRAPAPVLLLFATSDAVVASLTLWALIRRSDL